MLDPVTIHNPHRLQDDSSGPAHVATFVLKRRGKAVVVEASGRRIFPSLQDAHRELASLEKLLARPDDVQEVGSIEFDPRENLTDDELAQIFLRQLLEGVQ